MTGQAGLRIRVASSTASGSTALAAFDRALQDLGVHDLNLIALSSVIPAAATVVRAHASATEFIAGDRLYCVMAQERCIEPGAEAWAGLGWAADNNGRGGVFIEAHGASEHLVRYELEAGLEQLQADRPYWQFGASDYEVIGLACEGQPVCALALAIYKAEPW